nr:hypothetical protein [Tanacetum cinerariifolium]
GGICRGGGNGSDDNATGAVHLARRSPAEGESLPSVPDAYGQSFKALLSPSAASKNESHTTGVVSG